MILIKKVEFFLFQTPVWKLILFLFLIMFFKVGLFYHPNLWYHLEVARNPYNNIFIDRPELQSFYLSYFGSWLAYFVGATNKTSFFLLHLLFSMLYSFLFIRLIFKNFSNIIIGARRGSPLAVGYSKEENYIGSDSYALKLMTNKISYLDDGEVCVLTKDEVKFYDSKLKKIISKLL